MLYRHSEIFRSLVMGADLVLVAAAWMLAYWLRFETGLEVTKGQPPIQDYALALGVILPLWFVLCW